MPKGNYGSYPYSAQDPAIQQLKDQFDARGESKAGVCKRAGYGKKKQVSPSTVNNWFKGKTKEPKNCTVEAFGRALGGRRQWVWGK